MNTDSEIVSVNGNEYKYVEACINGKNITRIYNLTENTVDVICYDEFSGKVYLNNEQIAQVENNYSNLNDNVSTYANKYWTLHDKTDKIITWKKAVAAAVLAVIISNVIPKIGPATVIARIGLSALSVVASMCVKGHVKCASYVHVMPDASVKVKCDWTFAPTKGESYGPFSAYY